MPVKLGGLIRGKKGSKIVRTRNWSEAAEIVESILGSRYLLGAQIGDEITVKYVHEEWDGQWQHHYKIVVKHWTPSAPPAGFRLLNAYATTPWSRIPAAALS